MSLLTYVSSSISLPTLTCTHIHFQKDLLWKRSTDKQKLLTCCLKQLKIILGTEDQIVPENSGKVKTSVIPALSPDSFSPLFNTHQLICFLQILRVFILFPFCCFSKHILSRNYKLFLFDLVCHKNFCDKGFRGLCVRRK